MSEAIPVSYRKKPVKVTAVRWLGDNFDTIESFVIGDDADVRKKDDGSLGLWITKSQTWGTVRLNDWVIAERDGVGFYPCTAEQFTETYDPAE